MIKESSLTEKLMPSSKDEKDADKDNSLDIANLVGEVDRFIKLIEPIAFILYALEDIRRWRFPNTTISLWIIFNLSCIVLSKGAVFVLMSLAVVTIATMCLIHVHTRILDTVLPETRRESYVPADSVDDVTTLNTIKEFRYSLIQINDFLLKCNEYLGSFYAILKWDELGPSLRFHIEVCTFLLCLSIFPTRWNFLLFFNWFFLSHEEMLKYISKQSQDIFERWNETRQLDCSLASKNETDADVNSGKNIGSSMEKNGENLGKEVSASDADREVCTSESGANPDKMEPLPAKQGMVARFLELKKRRQCIANGCCFACNVSFSSFLKRRYYCRHCGNHFCARCCTQKVPKSFLGATAPAAQTETVLVCNICYNLLMKKDDKEKPS